MKNLGSSTDHRRGRSDRPRVDGTLADLGAHFGWFDQSHFSTDFVRVTGFSPAEYAQRKSARIS